MFAGAGRSAPSTPRRVDAGHRAAVTPITPSTLTSDGTTVLAAGSTRLELWRSDMVRVIGYGEVDARVKPSQTGVGKGCTLLSAAASPSAVSVLRSCGGEADVRLTLLRPGKDDDEPELRDVPEVGVSATSGARVLAVSGTTTAVYLPKPGPRVSIVDETGTELFSTPLPAPPTSAAEPGTVSRAGDLITWWTGDSCDGVLGGQADPPLHGVLHGPDRRRWDRRR